MSAPTAGPHNRKTKASQPAPAAAVNVGSDERELEPEVIARLAYLYWEARGYHGGSAEEDWLRAERELRNDIRRQGGNHGFTKPISR